MPEPFSDVHEEETPVPVDPIIPVFRQWAMLKAEIEISMRVRDKLRDRVVKAVEERGYRDHKGSQYIDLPFELEVGGYKYQRIKRERRVSISPDVDRAEEIIGSKGEEFLRRAFPMRPVFDPDELYVLLQEGVLTESDMDAIFVQHESYAFKGLAT
jgi:hypothetical protein